MDKEKILTVALVVAIIFGVASFASAIYFQRDRESLNQQLQELSEQTPAVTLAPVQKVERPQLSASDDNEDIAKLNAYIERLEAQLAAARQQAQSSERRAERNDRRGGGRGGRGPMDLEELKEKDPVRYEQIQQRMADFRQRQQEQAIKRNEFFDSVDTSRMTSEQRDTFNEYRDLLSQADAIMQGEGNMEDMREIGRGIFELRGQVQETLLQQLGSANGAANPAEFAANVRQVMSVTGMGGPGMGPGPGMMGGHGMGGGPGRRR